jgi:hypothetical protein
MRDGQTALALEPDRSGSHHNVLRTDTVREHPRLPADGQDRHCTLADHSFRDAAEHQATDSATTVGTDHDKISGPARRLIHDDVGNVSVVNIQHTLKTLSISIRLWACQ